LKCSYDHRTIDHSKEYAKGDIHINTLENFWALFKRTIVGTYIQIGRPHIERYLDEQAFRYNTKNTDDAGRFILAVSQMFGKRLTYDELTRRNKKKPVPKQE
jgi:hypothetical protein